MIYAVAPSAMRGRYDNSIAAKDSPKKTFINARAETVATTPMFHAAALQPVLVLRAPAAELPLRKMQMQAGGEYGIRSSVAAAAAAARRPFQMSGQRDPIRVWREEFARRALRVEFEPLGDAPFQARIEPVCPSVVRVAHSPGFTFRDKKLVRDGDDSFGFVICLSKPFSIAHRRRDFRLSRGEATLMHVSETGRVGSQVDVRYYAIKLRDPHLRARCADPESAVAHRVPRQCEALQLLRGYLGTAERTRLGHSAEMHETIGCHVADLVSLAVTWHGALGESSFSAVVAARLSAALEFAAAHFEDPELSLVAVARSQGVSPRYLQRLFEMTGTPFTARVNELRLERALALLAAPADGRLRISDVALKVGFSDISHFNRSFRARFGDTPTAVRAARSAASRSW